MWVLVFFPREQSDTVIDESQICSLADKKKKPNVGELVNVTWNDSELPAIVMKYGTNKAYLEKHHVDTKTLKVVLSPQPKPQKKKKELNLSKKREITVEKKTLEMAKRRTHAKFNEDLISSLNKRKLQRTNKQADDTDNNDYPKHPIKEEAQSEASFPLSPQMDDNSDAEENPVPKAQEVDSCLICNFCASLPVTQELIVVVEHLLNRLKLQFSVQSKNQAAVSEFMKQPEGHETPRVVHWKIPAPNKIEIMPNTGVWLDSAELKLKTTNLSGNRNELLRSLLKWIIGEKELGNLNALGTRGGKSGIERTLFDAVKKYVVKVTDTNAKGLNRVVNLMCGKLGGKSENPQKLPEADKDKKPSRAGTVRRGQRHPTDAVILSSSDDSTAGSRESKTINKDKAKESAPVKSRIKIKPATGGEDKLKPVSSRGTGCEYKKEAMVKKVPTKARSKMETSSSREHGFKSTVSKQKGFESETDNSMKSSPEQNRSNSLNSSSASTIDKERFESRLETSIVSSQSGDFSIDGHFNRSKSGKIKQQTKTSTPICKGKKRRFSENSSDYILGRRSASSSFTEVSPIPSKKGRVGVSPGATPEKCDKTPKKSKKHLSPIQDNVSNIPLPAISDHRDVPKNHKEATVGKENIKHTEDASQAVAINPPAPPETTYYSPWNNAEGYPFQPTGPQVHYYESYNGPSTSHNFNNYQYDASINPYTYNYTYENL